MSASATRTELAIHYNLVHTLKKGDKVQIKFGSYHMIWKAASPEMIEAARWNKIWEVLDVSNDERQFSLQYKYRTLYVEIGNDKNYSDFLFIKKVK